MRISLRLGALLMLAGLGACTQDVDIGTLRPGQWGVEGRDRDPGVNGGSSGMGSTSSSSGSSGDRCTEQQCGSKPPVANPEACPDGSPREVLFTCGRDAQGECGWSTAVTECRDTACMTDQECAAGQVCVAGVCQRGEPACQTSQCGVMPPVSEPEACPDGSPRTVTTTCEQDLMGSCRWHSEISECPVLRCMANTECPDREVCVAGVCTPEANSCPREACGEVPPVAPPQMCDDGSTEEITLTCEGAAGQCAWNIQRSGCPNEPLRCEADSECANAEDVCVNGICQPRGPGECTTDACGPPPPVAAPRTCPDGSVETVRVTCARGNGMCGWNVERSGCPEDLTPCTTNQECAPDQVCFNGVCRVGQPVECPADSCGPPPPVAPPMMCEDGSLETIRIACLGANGMCAWNVDRSGCPTTGRPCITDDACPDGQVCLNGVCRGEPNGCQPEACGPVPPVAPPQMCADGSVEQLRITCEGAAGRCGWSILRSGCPDIGFRCMADTDCPEGLVCQGEQCVRPETTCTPAECGRVPPVAPPQMCVDGSVEEIRVVCEGGNGQCGWNVYRGGCPDTPDACQLDTECDDGQACFNGQCRPVSNSCVPEQCGELPPVAPPQVCQDGSVEEVHFSCVGGGGMCGWNVTREGCRTTPNACMTNADCAAGQSCLNGVCR